MPKEPASLSEKIKAITQGVLYLAITAVVVKIGLLSPVQSLKYGDLEVVLQELKTTTEEKAKAEVRLASVSEEKLKTEVKLQATKVALNDTLDHYDALRTQALMLSQVSKPKNGVKVLDPEKVPDLKIYRKDFSEIDPAVLKRIKELPQRPVP